MTEQPASDKWAITIKAPNGADAEVFVYQRDLEGLRPRAKVEKIGNAIEDFLDELVWRHGA